MAIHAAIIKRAKAANIVLVENGEHIEARRGALVLAYNGSAKSALDKALELDEAARLRDLDPLPEDREPVLVGQLAPRPVAPPVVIKGSIIKSKYKDKYKKNGDYSCGDDIADELCAFIKVVFKGRMRVDLAKLKAVAVANGVWTERYSSLNPGQQRMTIGNRLRAKFQTGDQIDIGGAILLKEIVV